MKLQKRKPKFRRYRKKPIVIEAIRWDGRKDVFELIKSREPKVRMEWSKLVIPTLEGEMRADLGDYIIFGVREEPYPCKPDIFHMTYEEEPEVEVSVGCNEDNNPPDIIEKKELVCDVTISGESEENKYEIKVGALYRHFKGSYYKIITLAKHTEIGEILVIYEHVIFSKDGWQSTGEVWARPIFMWLDNVYIDGKLVPRFAKVCD